MSENIHGKVVVITGASSGLGAETARHLAREGAKVVLSARRLDRLEALASELGLDAKAILQTDVTDRSQVKALVDRAVELHGRIDVLLNNAGLMPSSMLDKLKSTSGSGCRSRRFYDNWRNDAIVRSLALKGAR